MKNIMQQNIIPMLVFVLMLAAANSAQAAGGTIELKAAKNDVGDTASLQRGARNFVNYCMGCHSAKYIRFNKLQQDLQLTEDQVLNNLMFAATKTDQMMDIAMPSEDAARWFGQAPPDLTLSARNRGTDWLYTFLKSFYIDESKPTGMNNLVLPGASMPHVLWEVQGLQRAIYADETYIDAEGNEETQKVFQRFELTTQGELTPQEYEQFVRDLVNFLDWAGTPEQLDRERLGIWVLLFLFVFLIFAYLLKVEIWKDVD